MAKEIGQGIFMWTGDERRSNRYGGFFLADSTFDDSVVVKTELAIGELNKFVGSRVKLTALVIENRESGHIGDHFLGVFPSKPDVGESIVIGIGDLVFEHMYEKEIFVLKPQDKREELWLDPRTLFRLHDQTVKIFIEQTDEDYHTVKPFMFTD